jgi:hypothetical protein
MTIYSTAQEALRYTAPIFKDYNVYKNIAYAEINKRNDNVNTKANFLHLDFYEPANDIAIARPLIILFPDGNYVTAQKQQTEIVDWCKKMTSFGYTCACVDYRQAYPTSIVKGAERAMYKGVQDGRAAIRYLKEFERTFRIDTGQIYVGGKFSGADVALHLAFMNTEIETFEDLGCLDCKGNNFEQKIDIKGVINFEGRVYSPSIMKNNKRIKVLNFAIEQGQTANAAQADNLQSIYNTNFIYRFLKRNDTQTLLYKLENANNSKFSISSDSISNKISAFLFSNLEYESPKPIGETEVCAFSVSKVTIPNTNDQIEWFVNNGTILNADNNSAEIIWNKVGEAKIQTIATSTNGLRCKISEPLIIQVVSQPIADFDIEYLSDNTIKVVDNSQYSNLLMLDFGNDEAFYQIKPKSSTFLSYTESGEYLITLTAEGNCGVSSQQIPIDINIPLSYLTSKMNNFIKNIPEKVNLNNNLTLSFSELKEVKIISLQIFDDRNDKVLNNIFNIAVQTIKIDLEKLIPGTYYLVFKTDQNIISTKKIEIL